VLLNPEIRLSNKISSQTIKSNQNQTPCFTTDDLAFSAYLKVQGFQLIRFNQNQSNCHFGFALEPQEAKQLFIDFINSPFAAYYNALRNLKKFF